MHTEKSKIIYILPIIKLFWNLGHDTRMEGDYERALVPAKAYFIEYISKGVSGNRGKTSMRQ